MSSRIRCKNNPNISLSTLISTSPKFLGSRVSSTVPKDHDNTRRVATMAKPPLARSDSMKMCDTFGDLGLKSNETQGTFQELSRVLTREDCNDGGGIFKRTRSSVANDAAPATRRRSIADHAVGASDASFSRTSSFSRTRSSGVRFDPYARGHTRVQADLSVTVSPPKVQNVRPRNVRKVVQDGDKELVERRLAHPRSVAGRWKDVGTRIKPQSEM